MELDVMIQFENVSVQFNKRTILHEFTVSLTENRIAIIGANGSGKSTFLRLLNGLVLPTQGRVTVHGLDTKSDGKMLRRKTGFVFQNPDNQIIMPTVEEDLAFGMKSLKLDKVETEQRIVTLLNNYGLLALRKQSTHFLSGGQKQILAICNVLAIDPLTIILDEPTTQLDLRNKKRVFEIIYGLEQQIIISSHDLPFLENFERTLVIHEGRFVFDGSPTEARIFYERLMQ